jgi:hypothetical protein
MRSRRPSETVSPWYASARELVLDLRSHTYLTGISTGKSHLYCIRRPPNSVYPF